MIEVERSAFRFCAKLCAFGFNGPNTTAKYCDEAARSDSIFPRLQLAIGTKRGEACPQDPSQQRAWSPQNQRNLSQLLRFHSSMAVLMPRERSISIRLSREEFSALENYCVASGARSISDLARNAICGLLNHAHEESALVSTVHEHSALVKNLQGKIEQLTTEIGLLKARKQSSRIEMIEGDVEVHDEMEIEK